MRTCSLVVVALASAPLPLQEPEWRQASSAYAWSFPEDHWARDGYKTEWWYFTGHLRTETTPARRYGYQFTVFRVGVTPETPPLASDWAARNVLMGHAAVIDLETGAHVFSEVLYRAVPWLAGFGRHPDPLIAWSRAPAGTDGRWTLRWNGAAFDLSMSDDRAGISLDLRTRPERPRIFQAPGGFSRKQADTPVGSMYYSFTRLATSGTVRIDGRAVPVSGRSWMDKEFGSNQLGDEQVGWDWFSLHLDDGRDVMLYLLRDRDGAPSFRHATVVEPDGAARFLGPTEWSVETRGRWTSPATDATYPAAWSVTLGTTTLEIEPLAADQENVSRLVRGLYYWEGAVAVRSPTGGAAGRGFVELTGYGAGSRPAI